MKSKIYEYKNQNKIVMSKNIFNLSFLFLATFASAQVAIGKPAITTIPPANTAINSSISLEFGDYTALNGKGIILPWVTSEAAVTGAVSGTIIYDINDKIMKYKVPTSVSATGWFNLSKNETTTVGGTANFDTTGVVNPALQNALDGSGNPLSDATTAKVSIGVPATPDIPGILVLEDATKAMILPKLPSPHLNIINPEPGTMAFDTTTNQLAVYNGKVWSFWKP